MASRVASMRSKATLVLRFISQSAAVQRLWGTLLGAFCVYNMGAILLANMPTSTAFGGELRAPFESYIAYTGIWQNWSMFVTIPYFKSIHPVLVAHYANGKDVERGPILPGLRPYRPRARFIALFVGYAFPPEEEDWFARSYVQRACTAFEQATGARPKSVRLRLDCERLQPLSDVVRTGKIGVVSHEPSAVEAICD
jgi:hypothetical protein